MRWEKKESHSDGEKDASDGRCSRVIARIDTKHRTESRLKPRSFMFAHFSFSTLDLIPPQHKAHVCNLITEKHRS